VQRKPFAALVTGLVVLGFAMFGILAADAGNPSGFVPVVNPLSQVPAGGSLRGTTCPAAGFCVAVGEDDNGLPLTLAGDPSAWTAAQATEIALDATRSGGRLESVACTSSTSCIAVGEDSNFQPLVLAGDPSTWSGSQAQEIALGGPFGDSGSLNAVTCSSATSCVAVGDDGRGQPFVLSGDPSTWGVAQAQEITLGGAFGSSSYSRLSSVTCTSSTACVAVGEDANGQPLVLAGDPSTWGAAQAQEITIGAALGGGGGLGSLTCASPTSCVAVGWDGNGQPLVLTGDPSTWSATQASEITLGVTFGGGGEFASIACSSATSCVAVGLTTKPQPLTLAGDPATWGAGQARMIKLGKAFGQSGYLGSSLRVAGVACTSAAACVAVGEDANGQPLQLAGDPATWGPAQTEELTLSGVARGVRALPWVLTCVSAGSCFDLGFSYANRPGGGEYLLQGNPATWDEAGTTLLTHLYSWPSPGHPRPSGLYGVACTSSTRCVAVGVRGLRVLVVVGNPATWGTAKGRTISLGRTFGIGQVLTSVTCPSPHYCIAVGWDESASGYQPLVLVGNPATWAAADARQITLGRRSYSGGRLASVSCSSRTSCVAVGSHGRDYSVQQPIVLAGNPASWTAADAKEITLGKTLGSRGGLSSVACPSRTFCVSVGSSGTNTKPLVLAGNPRNWDATSAFRLRGTPVTASSVRGFFPSVPQGLTSVSCKTATYCLAVGGGGSNDAPFYITGNPAHWKTRLLQRPAEDGASFVTARLMTSACTPQMCFAGGFANGGDFVATLK
jgi:hypothetical protein